jgi:hypothetical protein
MLKISSVKNYYVVTLECLHFYQSTISRMPYLSFFVEFLQDIEDVTLFEIKIRIITEVLPFIKRKQVEDLMDTMQKIINLPTHKSIITVNLNPIRCAFLLYKLINDIEYEKGYSGYVCNRMREQVENKIVSCIESFTDPADLVPLIETKDYLG